MMFECPKTLRCENCHEHFQMLRPQITSVLLSNHFKRDFPDFDINLILSCEHEHFTRLHKFEEKIDKAYIFRAVYNEKHIVYAIADKKLIFLRSFANFKEYGKFLSDKKKIKELIESVK